MLTSFKEFLRDRAVQKEHVSSSAIYDCIRRCSVVYEIFYMIIIKITLIIITMIYTHLYNYRDIDTHVFLS